jgi:hypothetical protein
MEYHDHGYPMIEAVSSSSSVSHVVVMGGYAPVSVVIVVIGGWLPPYTWICTC